jgi:ubiquinone/menaquinone biosynthesis C-methylase UbiE
LLYDVQIKTNFKTRKFNLAFLKLFTFISEMFNNKKEIIAKTFDQASQKFDGIGTPFFKHYGKILADFAEIKQDDCVLDIACGKGAATFPVLDKLSGDGKIYGIDISPNMIAECKKLINHSSKNVHFLVMDAENIEFGDESFDKVICGFGLFFLPDIEKGINEIKRVLKPGGLLIFSSWNKNYQMKWLPDIIAKYIPDIIINNVVCEDKIHENDFKTIPGIEKILKITGFKKEQIIVENIDCFYKSEEEWIETRWHTAFRMYFEKLSKKNYASLKDEIIYNLQDYKYDGKIKIKMSAFITKASK